MIYTLVRLAVVLNYLGIFFMLYFQLNQDFDLVSFCVSISETKRLSFSQTDERQPSPDWKSVAFVGKGLVAKCTLRFDRCTHCTRSHRDIYFHRWPTLR